ncbi:hypothetical protein DAPPUDRAFT_320664 [Daphnia pulex]|uniref:Vta1/callose synthase N-terminal domain-containing protein n=1 Tax=Daphnia pulex TaxID=6669 RepID=E9GQT6_DAPPU|nr:hypothetical protein DAPPUDRAFT_320664 [Daphnia pulex]|eukprot:EFX78275.1 hypothetical protein DAPPUDRAFT_320664 [Daphnia pulex]
MATSPLTCLSNDLKSIEPYLDIATDFENLYPSVSYLCRFYALQKGFTLYKAEDDLPVLLELMSLLSHTSASLSDKTMNEIEDLALKFIEWGETAPTLEKYNEITFKSFYSAKLLLDVCVLFGELKATTAEKKKCITSKVMDMQESRALLMKENQASLLKQEQTSKETEDSMAHFDEGSLVKRQAVDGLYPQLTIKELLKNVQPRTAQILYLQSNDLNTSPTDLLQEMPVGFCEPPRQVFVVPSPVADFVTAADNASKAKTSPSEIQEIHITPSVHAAITPSNATTKLDEVEVEEKALQSVIVSQTLQTPDSTSAGISTLGVKQKVSMANPGHCGQTQGEPTVRNNQFSNRFMHPKNQRMTRSPILLPFPCHPANVHQSFNYPKFNVSICILTFK